jgi:multicomponent Na+:H+ antiporter subunit C
MFEEGSIFTQLLVERLNYFIYVVLLLIGLWAMIAKNNLIKKLIGMSIFQTAIILFYVSIGVKEGATIPIYLPEHDPHASHGSAEHNNTAVSDPQVLETSEVSGYTNPLPHVLMLTAIVVGVATLGLALSICLRIYRGYGTVEEDDLLLKLEQEDSRNAGGFKKRRPRRRTSSTKVSSGAAQAVSSEKSKSDRTGQGNRRSRSKPPAKKSHSSSTNDGKKPARRRPRPKKPKEGDS